MEQATRLTVHEGLEDHGILNPRRVYWNLNAAQLYEQAVRRREGLLAENGQLVVRTGKYTGRSPQDRFFVREPYTEHDIAWGKVNRAFPGDFERLHARLLAYLQGRDLFVQDVYSGADQGRLSVRLISESAWHALFARTMFIRRDAPPPLGFDPDVTVLHAPGFLAVPEVDGTRSEAFIVLNLSKKLVLIGGTQYGGEIKKSIFTMMNFLLPLQGILSMHCSANVGPRGDTALFFGLSGTGKTTLSADPERRLIGDDEHGWDERGVFNFEGGCYAKVIRLSASAEPQIHAAVHRFGTLLENVVVNPDTRRLNLDDDSLTENTRAVYPLTHLDAIVPGGRGEHPKNIVFLTCDAFGVMPPLARLTTQQAMYHFLAGYTAKVAGTERGVREPQATFSTCFGAPFMALRPSVYAELLGRKIEQHGARVWLVNTGWTGGPYGVGHRISIAHTRAMARCALSGELDAGRWRVDPTFGVEVPTSCPGVPDELLDPRRTWRDPQAFETQARTLADMFAKNAVGGQAPVT
ncbi:MAG: phosphoenolpyruvate carboxykinase (ATP) [Acidobacteria bacterium]|nr:phosphoenolpyruvate carboxykinase (ATP) [Acidobacteriota bacterium]